MLSKKKTTKLPNFSKYHNDNVKFNLILQQIQMF